MSSKLINFMMTSGTTKNDTIKTRTLEDDDVICLSSDTDDELQPSAKIAQQAISNGKNNNTLKRKLPSRPGPLSRKRPSTSINGVQTPQPVQPTASDVIEPEPAERILPALSSAIIEIDDEEFEIEFARDTIAGTSNASVLPNSPFEYASDSDDDIQVLEENVLADASALVISSKPLVNHDPVAGHSSVVNNANKGPSMIPPKPQQQSWNLIKMFISEVKKNETNFNSINKLEEKFKKKYEIIKELDAEIHKRFHEEVENALVNLADFPNKTWAVINELKALLKPETFKALKSVSAEERSQQRAKKKTELTKKYEACLKKIHNTIMNLRETEVDWDDEHNSSYLLEDRYKKKFMTEYYKLCDIYKCNKFTDRPVQKKINLRKLGESSGYRVIDDEVEKFLNKQGFLFIPDFTDILNIIKKVNKTNGLNMTTESSLETAKKIFQKVALLIKHRREKDFKLTFFETLLEDYGNPAEEDEELERKLKENEKLYKKESDVLDHFNKLAEDQGKQAKEVDQNDDANSSPLPSDDEDDGEDEGDDETEEEEDEDTEKKREKMEAHQHEELTEDEDEESNDTTIANAPIDQGSTNTSCTVPGSLSLTPSSTVHGTGTIPIINVDSNSSQSLSSPNGIKRIVPTRLIDQPTPTKGPDLAEVETPSQISTLINVTDPM